MASSLISPDDKNKYEDLSGVQVRPGENPYQALITASNDGPAQIQARYDAHRITRNAQQRANFLAPDFREVLIDPFLLRIEDPSVEPSFEDTRNSVVFWARPPEHILCLAARVQERLKKAAPNIWLMPLHRMHMTALELCHSRTPEEADSFIRTMTNARLASADPDKHESESGIASIVNYTYRHRARLVRPMVSYDLAAAALSFVPAAGEPNASPLPVAPAGAAASARTDAYTYHHLRRDLHGRTLETGVPIASRYIVPSAHITLARFLSQEDHATPAARQAWVDAIDEINAWLQREVWPATWVSATSSQPTKAPPPPRDRLVGEWVVGQERGLDARVGPLWYGGGRTVILGEGF